MESVVDHQIHVQQVLYLDILLDHVAVPKHGHVLVLMDDLLQHVILLMRPATLVLRIQRFQIKESLRYDLRVVSDNPGSMGLPIVDIPVLVDTRVLDVQLLLLTTVLLMLCWIAN
jgi:hypothetical protein